MTHLDTDVKVLVDTHSDEHTIGQLRKEYKIDMAKYNIIGSFQRKEELLYSLENQVGMKDQISN